MKFSHGWMADTHPEALRVYLELNHRRSAQQKFDTVIAMGRGIESTYEAQERRLHPHESDGQIFLRVAVRRLGEDLVRRAYGALPNE